MLFNEQHTQLVLRTAGIEPLMASAAAMALNGVVCTGMADEGDHGNVVINGVADGAQWPELYRRLHELPQGFVSIDETVNASGEVEFEVFMTKEALTEDDAEGLVDFMSSQYEPETEDTVD